jgi:hypothetical protein
MLAKFLSCYARDQWFPTYKLRICEIWTKLSHQNHFSIRTLIFPSGQSLSENVHYHQCDIFRKKLKKFDPWSPVIEQWYPRGGIKISDTTYVVYGFPLLRQYHRRISMTSCTLLDRSTWCHSYVGVMSSRRHGELGVWNSRTKLFFGSFCGIGKI